MDAMAEARAALARFREATTEHNGMRKSESIELTGARIEITDDELTKINGANPTASFTMESVVEKKVYAVEAVLIDSIPTRNRNEYTAAWQESMVEKWVGTKLVYSEDDHAPNAPDDYGWVYNAHLETDNGITRTVARIVVPVIEDTKRLVERLRSGLNHSVSIAVEVEHAVCAECGEAVSTKTGRCLEHTGAITQMIDGGHPIHVALVGDAGCRNAGIRATSESLRVVETIAEEKETPTDNAILIEDGRKARAPVIAEAVKYARLNDAGADATALQERFDKWTADEIRMFAETQREAFIKTHPQATEQLSVGGESIEDNRPHLTSEDILKRLREEK